MPGIKPTILDRESSGGDSAEGGFIFQKHLTMIRIPQWLACDGFIEMVRESLADTEARFFLPALGIKREFIEFKNHNLVPSEFWPEIQRFQRMDVAHPEGFWRFLIVSPSVSNQLNPMINALRRVRETFPFYRDVPSIQDSAYEAFVKILKSLEKDDALASFIFKKVFIDTNPQKNVDQGFNAFRGSLEKHFPIFEKLGTSYARAAWDALSDLLEERKAQPICRDELLGAIFGGNLQEQRSDRTPIRILTANEKPSDTWGLPQEICMEWFEFSGGDDRTFPPKEEWNNTVVKQLLATRDFIVSTNRNRKISLVGQRRLSPSIAIGSIFSGVRGFSIDIVANGETWSTDDHSSPRTPDYEWQITSPNQPLGNDLALCIGVCSNPEPEVRNYLEKRNMPLLALFGKQALVSAQQINLAVGKAKEVISAFTTKARAQTIHLFIAAPAQFAIFFGHRLNATAKIQCYERIGVNSYVPTCSLNCL